MNTTVRQSILTSIKGIMESLSFKHVEINRSTPVDLDTVAFPACFIYSGSEERATKEQVVGSETWKWEVQIEVWLREGDDDEETVLGRIHEAMFNNYSFDSNASYSCRTGAALQILDPARAIRAMRVSYDVTYRHREGQPDTKLY